VTTVQQVLEVAASQNGYVEGPNNATKYGAWYGVDHQPWCAMFTSWVYAAAGMTQEEYVHAAYCPSAVNAGKARGWIVNTPEPGDQAVYRLGALGYVRACHTGIVASVDLARGTITAWEGNTDEAGGRTGGKVMLKTRPLAGYSARPTVYIRPRFSSVVTPPVVTPIEEEDMKVLFHHATGVYGLGDGKLFGVKTENDKAQLQAIGFVATPGQISNAQLAELVKQYGYNAS
jgi:hypothetical protein